MRAGWLALGLVLLGAWAARGDELRVAVAANFRGTCEELAREFEAQRGHQVVLSVGSTGSLFAQIENGAPFDLFLAADARRPQELEARGRALARGTYALGRLALVGPGLAEGAAGEAALRTGSFAHLALAQPERAPYGAAAREVLERLGLWAQLEPRVVYGESVGQVDQFVRSGSAELGFVAGAQAAAGGWRAVWRVPAELHAPIRQDAVLLSRSAAARELFEWLRGPEARARILAAGYGVAEDSGPVAGPRPAESRDDWGWGPVRTTLALATCSTGVLLVLGTPLAWWLARGASAWRLPVEAAVALPLVLPPTVLGFYLLVLLGPAGPIGAAWEGLGGPRLVFSFPGLVLGSVVYSLPFVVQPLRASFQAIDPTLLEAAATLRAGPWDRFRSVILPLARPGLLTATVLGFAHTVGEFGVVLMLGGSIPGQTRVLSIAIFDHVEQLEYGRAHLLAGGMLAFSFLTLLLVYASQRRFERVGP